MKNRTSIHLTPWFATLLFSVLPAISAPHGQPIDCMIHVGFGDDKIVYAPPSASLIPVTILVANDVGNTKGHIEITHKMTGTPEVRERVAFSSPKNSTKQFTVLTRHQPGLPLRVAVRFDEHIVDVSRLIPVKTAKNPMVVCVGVPEGTSMRKRIRQFYRCVDMPVELLPDDPRAYEGLHSLAIHGMEFTRLAPSQLAAIRAWLVTGGRLAVITPLDERPFMNHAAALAGEDAAALMSRGVHMVGSGMVCSPGLGSGH